MAIPKNETKVLSTAQKRHFERLLHGLTEAETQLAEAQKARDTAHANASTFVDYCAEELGIGTEELHAPVGDKRWFFNQPLLRFELTPVEKGQEEKANGNHS